MGQDLDPGLHAAPEDPASVPHAAPAVVVHDAAGAAAALALASAHGVLLLSAPGAAGSLGAAGFLALVAQAAAGLGRPAPPHAAVLDCADAPGHALAALRAGLRVLVLAPSVPGFAAVAGAAAEAGARLLPARPEALDLRGLDLARPVARARLGAWLAAPAAAGPADDI